VNKWQKSQLKLRKPFGFFAFFPTNYRGVPMNLSSFGKSLRWSLILLIGMISLPAMTAPQVDDLVEIRGWLNARSEANFRGEENKLAVLAPGTRAVVVETTYFSQTKNYGVCLKTLDSTSGDRCVWVYYKNSDPNMTLYAVHSDADGRQALLHRWMSSQNTKTDLKKMSTAVATVSSPEDAQAARLTRKASGIIEREVATDALSAAGKVAAVAMGTDVGNLKTMLSGTLSAITSINNDMQKVLNPTPVCKDCATEIKSYEQCSSKNDYLEPVLKNLKDNSLMSKVLSSQHDIIRPICFQKSLETFQASHAFFQCKPGTNGRSSHSLPKPCASENYVNTVAKSFNVVADCLSGYVSGTQDESVKDITALSIFAMMNVESGFHVNVMSPTGAGGPGQFTQPAIDCVNRNMDDLKDYLSQVKSPLCKETILKALNPPMDGRPSRSCERINPQENNPLRNLVYTFAYQANLRRYINGVFENPAYKEILSGLSPSYRESVLAAMMTWAHNAGSAGVEVPLRHLLRTMVQKNQRMHSREDIIAFFTNLTRDMKRYPARANSSAARLRETSIYYPSITSRMHDISSQVSGGVRGCLAD
jgi:hypothetical protein